MAIAWATYLKRALNFQLSPFWSGSVITDGQYHFGINILALSAVIAVTLICIFGGVSKSARLNFALVCLKLILLTTFLVTAFKHIESAELGTLYAQGFHWRYQGAALAVFPYVGFDALYTFARESKSLKDTRLATYMCVSVVAFLYVTVMAAACGLAQAFLMVIPHDRIHYLSARKRRRPWLCSYRLSVRPTSPD